MQQKKWPHKTASKKDRNQSRDYLEIVNRTQYKTAENIITGEEVDTDALRVIGDGDNEHRDRILRILKAWALEEKLV